MLRGVSGMERRMRLVGPGSRQGLTREKDSGVGHTFFSLRRCTTVTPVSRCYAVSHTLVLCWRTIFLSRIILAFDKPRAGLSKQRFGAPTAPTAWQ